jgi:hypothetical protein
MPKTSNPSSEEGGRAESLRKKYGLEDELRRCTWHKSKITPIESKDYKWQALLSSRYLKSKSAEISSAISNGRSIEFIPEKSCGLSTAVIVGKMVKKESQAIMGNFQSTVFEVSEEAFSNSEPSSRSGIIDALSLSQINKEDEIIGML